MNLTIKAHRLFDGEKWHQDIWLRVEDGRITAIDHYPLTPTYTELDGIVLPGFIDLQVNGGGGVLFNDQPNVDGIRAIASAHRRFGTTGFLPTLITDSLKKMEQAASAVSQAISEGVAGVLGIHFEGPHLCAEKRGVHDANHIRPLSNEEITLYCRDDLGSVVVTLAPEVVPNEQISQLAQAGVRVCLGHSNATYEQVVAAIEAGASGFTHLFNAMSPFTSREPGVVGAALSDKTSWCGFIADGHHLHPETLKLALSCRPEDKMFLVTDAMPPAANGPSSFNLQGRQIVSEEGRLTAPSGELAGSSLNMAATVRYCVEKLDVSPERAARMASTIPAEFLGCTDLGRLKVGSPANIVVASSQFYVKDTIVGMAGCKHHR